MKAVVGIKLIAIVAVLFGAALATAQDLAAAVAEVTAGSEKLTGVFVNDGGLFVTARPASQGEVIARFEGEAYPATLVKDMPGQGIALFHVSRQKAFPHATFTSRLVPTGSAVKLLGIEGGALKSWPASIVQLRRKLAEISLEGSAYELLVPGAVPIPGALLVDDTTGAMYAMLIKGKSTGGSLVAILGSDILQHIASTGSNLGSSKPVSGPIAQFSDGRQAEVSSRTLEFRSNNLDRVKTLRIAAMQDFKNNTGFWLSQYSSPYIEGSTCYFGSAEGTLYAVNLKTLDRIWPYHTDYPIFYSPEVSGDLVCVSSGSLQLMARQNRDTSLADAVTALGWVGGYDLSFLGGMFTFKHTVHDMWDMGQITCVNKSTGVFKWQFDTRFTTKPVIVGQNVIFSGLDCLGVLQLADGKKVWELEKNRKRDRPKYYVVGGADSKRLWTLVLPTHVVGGTNPNPSLDPLRLEQDKSDVLVESYRMDKKDKPIWSTKLKVGAKAPAMSGLLVASEDHKLLYGACGQDAFCVDAETGEVRWQTQVFATPFAGSFLVSEGMLFAITNESKVSDTSQKSSLLAIDGSNGKQVWAFEARLPLCAPAIDAGVVYVGSLDTNMYAFDARLGKKLWQMELGGKICGQPKIIGDKLYCLTDDGRITELTLPR